MIEMVIDYCDCYLVIILYIRGCIIVLQNCNFVLNFGGYFYISFYEVVVFGCVQNVGDDKL